MNLTTYNSKQISDRYQGYLQSDTPIKTDFCYIFRIFFPNIPIKTARFLTDIDSEDNYGLTL